MYRRWGVVGGLLACSALSNAYMIAPAGVMPSLMAGLSVGPSTAGLVASVTFGVQIVASLPAGVLVDSRDPRRVVAGAALALAVAGAWGTVAALRGDVVSLVASRLLGGTASVVVWTAGVTVIGALFDRSSRGTAVGVFTAGAPAGFALTQVGGPVVATELGWSYVFVVPGALALVPFAAFWTSSAGTTLGGGAASPPTRTEFGRVVADARVLLVSGMAFLAFSLFVLLNSWLPTYLTESLGVPEATGGLVVALFPAVGVLSRSGGGVVSDRVFDSRRRPVAVLSFLVGAPAAAAIGLTTAVPAVLALLVVAGFFVQLGMGSFFAYAREVVDPSVAGTAVSLVTGASSFGAFLAPVVAGWLIEATGAYVAVFVLAAVLGAAGVAVAVRAPET
ncbi:MAG: nitrate/nitrite transporter [Halobacteriaceae archaeon]